MIDAIHWAWNGGNFNQMFRKALFAGGLKETGGHGIGDVDARGREPDGLVIHDDEAEPG